MNVYVYGYNIPIQTIIFAPCNAQGAKVRTTHRYLCFSHWPFLHYLKSHAKLVGFKEQKKKYFAFFKSPNLAPCLPNLP